MPARNRHACYFRRPRDATETGIMAGRFSRDSCGGVARRAAVRARVVRRGKQSVPDSEVELVSRAVRGDADALTELLRTHGPRVRRSLRIASIWRALIEVDDVMQVTYLEAFLRIGQLVARTPAGFRTWLTRLATNNLTDAIRQLERQKRLNPRNQVHPLSADESVTALLGSLGATTTTVGGELVKREDHADLERALERLPETYRRVVRLVDLDGCPALDAAQQLGKSPGAIYMLRARAHDRLRELLDHHDGETQ